jgi:hypothetical protein
MTTPTTPTAPATPVVAPKPAPAKRQSRASRSAAANTAPAKADRKLAIVPAAKPTAAKPAKVAKVAAGPTRTQQNRIVAAAMVDAVAKMIDGWTSAVEKRTGVSKSVARAGVSSWLNYAPCGDHWASSLDDRSGAGGRGAKGRAKSA